MNSSIFSTTTTFLLLLVALLLRGLYVTSTTFTFINKCDHTVWPGLLAGASSPKLDSTGFELPQGGTRTLPAPVGWSGRFWGRTNCNFDSTGVGSCLTGDCGSGQVECNGAGAAPPATLAEFTLNGSGGQDFYDVSLVDGYNIQMIVESSGGTGGCQTTGCIADLNRRCPTELQSESGGACRSACEAFGNPEYCCSGDYGSPATCKPSAYSQLFKNACPRAYSYAYDDASSTFTCSGADYTITFCPSTPSQKSSMDPSAGVGANPGSNSVHGAVTGSSSGSGSASLMADGSWLANLASGSSSNLRHPTIALHFGLLFFLVTIFN
ncbi:hypothetical protein KSS87_002918 [Heliosperma pusillum]|nr:hypothetical protein KSS87_002918 [Heliosperma pusillum]